MCLSFFNPVRLFRKKITPPSSFEIKMAELMQKSEEARQEIARESFNSETLKTLCSPGFRTQKPNCLMAVSTQNPNSPVEVCYRKTQENDVVNIDIFLNGRDKLILGTKSYVVETDNNGNMIMKSGSMHSDEDACEKAGVKGIGILERIIQINDAIANGIKSIPCMSYARAVLFHLKTGFLPVPKLTEIKTLYDLDTIMAKKTKYVGSDIDPKNYTPIIVSKDGKYYLDENTTQCVASLRQILQNYKAGYSDGVRPFIRGRCVELVLEGKNFDFWKRLLEKS